VGTTGILPVETPNIQIERASKIASPLPENRERAGGLSAARIPCAITSIPSATNSGNRSFREFETSSVVAVMRILTIVDLPWDARLGAVRIFMELSRAWAAAGHDVRIIV